MQRSGSQKFLLVVSILNLIFNGLAILAMLAFGVVAGGRDIAGGAFGLISLAGVGLGLISIIEGILGLRAANDATKIMPVWYLAVIGLVIAVVACAVSIFNGNFGSNASSFIGSVLGSGLTFWIANNIKRQAGM